MRLRWKKKIEQSFDEKAKAYGDYDDEPGIHD